MTKSDNKADLEFELFYRANFASLIAFLIRQGVPLRDAADTAQAAMIDAYRAWTTIDYPRSWIRRVAARKWTRKVADDLIEPSSDPTLLSITDIRAWEQEQEILRLLSHLPTRQRQVLAWTVDGFTPTEIAFELDMTADAVRSSLKLARRALAERLEEEGRHHD